MANFTNCNLFFGDTKEWAYRTDTPSPSFRLWPGTTCDIQGFVPYAPLIHSFLLTSALYLYATIFTLHLPVYFRRRSITFLKSFPTGAPELANIWATVFLPIVEKWKGIVVLSALTSSAILGMIQASPTLSQDALTLSIAYFTLIGTMIAVLISTVLLLHVSGRECDETFVLSWVEEMKNCSAMSLWSIWTVISLPSIWSAWTSVGFVTVVMLQIWKDPDVQISLPAAGASALVISSADNPGKPFPIFAAGLTAPILTGLLQILGLFVTFWRIEVRWRQVDQEVKGTSVVERVASVTSQGDPLTVPE